MKTLRKHHLFVIGALSLLFLLLRFAPMLLGQTLYFGDNFSLLVPGKLFTVSWLKQGIIPLWNPTIFGGIPWIGDVSQFVFYPSTLFFLFFSPGVALNLTVVSHLLITSIGMFLLALQFSNKKPLAVLAGLLWMLSTQVSGSVNNLATLQSLVWLPWVIVAGMQLVSNSRWLLAFGLIVLLQLMGGYPQHVLYSVLTAGLFSAVAAWHDSDMTWKQWILRWLMAGTWAVSISAFVWMPFVQATLASTRMEQNTQQAVSGSLNPLMLIKAIFPYFFDKPSAGMKWGPAWNGQPNVVLYVTWVGLFALVASLKRFSKKEMWPWVFAVLAGGTLLFSLGSYLPGFETLYQLVPVFKIARYPSMLLIITNLVLILWMIQELPKVRLQKQHWQFVSRMGAFVLFAGVFGWVINALYADWLWNTLNQISQHRLAASPFHTPARDEVIFSVIGLNVITASLGFITALWALRNKKWWLLVVVMAVDILVHTQGMFFFADTAIYEQKQQPMFAQQLSDPQYRVLTRNSNKPYTDFGTYWEALVVRAPFSDSFIDAEELNTEAGLIRLQQGHTPNWNMVYDISAVHGYTTLLPADYAQTWQRDAEPNINFIDRVDLDNPQLAAWSAKYYLVDTWFEVSEALPETLVAQQDHWQLYELPAQPRFRSGNNEEIIVSALTETPNTIALTVENPNNAAVLVVADRYDADWQVIRNSERVKLLNLGGQRAVALESGTNQIEFRYAPQWWYYGLFVSALAAMLASGYLLRKQYARH